MKPFNYDYNNKNFRKYITKTIVFTCLAIVIFAANIYLGSCAISYELNIVCTLASSICGFLGFGFGILALALSASNKMNKKVFNASQDSRNIKCYRVADCRLCVSYNKTEYELNHLYTPRKTISGEMSAPYVKINKDVDFDYHFKPEDAEICGEQDKILVTKPDEFTLSSYFLIKLEPVDVPDGKIEELRVIHDAPLGYYIRACSVDGRLYFEKENDIPVFNQLRP